MKSNDNSNRFTKMMSVLIISLACLVQTGPAHSLASPRPPPPPSARIVRARRREERREQRRLERYGATESLTSPPPTAPKKREDKFSLFQRLESVKTGVVGLVSGSVAATPFIALHDLPAYGVASWEFDTDMGGLESALFAIVYRYCAREDDDNDMLNMGAVGAFVVVRTLSRIRVPYYCSAAPLDCGDPLGYFDYDMIRQLALNGLESAALFGGAAAAMEYAYSRKWISKFPN